MTGELFKARFADCHFDESVYPTLGGEHKLLGKEIDWNSSSLSHLDPRTNQCEHEVQRIMYLQNIANQLPDAFTNLPRLLNRIFQLLMLQFELISRRDKLLRQMSLDHI